MVGALELATKAPGGQAPALAHGASAAETLVVTGAGDLSPPDSTLAPLLAWFLDPGRDLVAIDLAIDTRASA